MSKRLDRVEISRDLVGEWRHRRISFNGQVIATCHEGYTSHAHTRRMAAKIYKAPYVLIDHGVRTVVTA